MLALGISIARVGYLVCSTVLLGVEITEMIRKKVDDDKQS